MTQKDLPYAALGREYRGTVIMDERQAVRAAVVLLPDWRGQSDLARDHASHLVGLGCAVAIADLYGDGFNPGSPADVGPMVQRLIAHRSEGVAGLAACIAALKEHAGGDSPMLCLGFSAGGMVALDYARSGSPIDGVMTCSALLKTAASATETRCAAPVLIVQGTQDQVSPMSVIAEVVAEMDAAGNDLRLLLLSQTHHAFDNPDAGDDPTQRLCYSPRSAARAREAIATFIDERVAAR